MSRAVVYGFDVRILPRISFRAKSVAISCPMKSAVFDKNFIGAVSGHDHPCQVDPRHIALERSGVAHGQPGRALQNALPGFQGIRSLDDNQSAQKQSHSLD